MAYPANVTEPPLGFYAFARNDAASQLAQAAYLLLLGRELRRRRGVTRSRRHVLAEAPLDEDALAFDIPVIRGSARRYVPPELPRTSDELHEIARDLAVILQAEAHEAIAADLLHVCLARPEPIVRVAAAAAAFEITSDARRVIDVLAHATADDDHLVRDVAATALARVMPEHPALLRLVTRPSTPPTAGTARTSLLVHGTFARTDAWWQPGGDFHGYLLNGTLPDLYDQPDRFEWSGGYSDAARELAAQDLAAWAQDHALAEGLLMGHSHGANVIFIVSTLNLAMREAVLLSCPVRWPQYLPDFSRIGRTVSIRVHLDLVILADGAGQRFDDARVDENVLPVWFNHSATHDPAVWQAHGVDALI
jgi:hypothetical protein